MWPEICGALHRVLFLRAVYFRSYVVGMTGLGVGDGKKRAGRDEIGQWRHPAEMGIREINQFLKMLAVARNVAASTQIPALSQIVFLDKQILKTETQINGPGVAAKTGMSADGIQLVPPHKPSVALQNSYSKCVGYLTAPPTVHPECLSNQKPTLWCWRRWQFRDPKHLK